MPRLTSRIPRTLEDVIAAVVELQREMAAWVEGDDMREERARRELAEALDGARRLFDASSTRLRDEVMAEVTPLRADVEGMRGAIAEILAHSKASAEERDARKARETAEAVAREEVEAKWRRWRAAAKILVPVLLALIGLMGGAAASHLTEGPHGTGGGETKEK